MDTESLGKRQEMTFDKPDAVRKHLVPYLRDLGFSYRDLPATKKGQPDGLVGRGGKDCQVEFKTAKAKLTEAQAVYRLNWRGAKVRVLRTEADCMALLLEW